MTYEELKDKRTAEEAQKTATEGMTPDAIFNALTNNGQNQGLYRGEDGELYINASYIVAGILKSLNGATKFHLDDGSIVCTDDFGQSVEIANGLVSLYDNEGLLNLRLYSLGGAGGITFHAGEDERIVGSMLGDTNGLSTSFKKVTLYSGNVVAGDSFTVRNTANYDLFAVKLGDSSGTEDTVVLAYKNGNTINGVGGWAGTASLAKEMFFVSATFSGTTWTLVDARKQGIYNAGSITTGTALNVKEIIGVI